MAHYRVADEQDFSLRPEKDNLSQRFSRRADHYKRASLFAESQFVSQLRAVARRVWRVRWMARRPRAGARANLVRGAGVVPIGDENTGDTLPRELRQIVVTRLHGIDTKIPIGVFNEVPVKIVAVRFREPRPSEDVG